MVSLSGRNSGGVKAPPPSPSVNRHSLSETIEYTKIDRKNYWRMSTEHSTEHRFDYLETICLISCVNHISHFCACSYLLKEPKTLKNQFNLSEIREALPLHLLT